MPTPMADNSIILVTWWQKYQNQYLLNTQHYKFGQTNPVLDYRAEMEFLRQTFAAAGDVNDKMVAIASTSWTLEFITFQPIYPDRLRAVSVTPQTPGAVVGTTSPSNVAATFVKEADVGKRFGTGVWHQGGLPAAVVAGGVMSPGLITQMGDLATKLLRLDRFTVNGTYKPVLWSPSLPGRATQVEAWHTENTSRVMHRRTHFLGI